MRATAPCRNLRRRFRQALVLAACTGGVALAQAQAQAPVQAHMAALAGFGDGEPPLAAAAKSAAITPSSEVVPLSGRVERPNAAPLQRSHASDEVAGVSYRLWMSRGRTAVGVGLGALGRVMVTPAESASPESAPAAPALTDTAPVVSVAMRYRTSEHSAVYADASLAHDFAGPEGVGGYSNAKVGVEWKSAKPSFGLERGRLAVQLDSGYRMSFRIRKSGLGVYLRGQF